jgi:hypothetical protein
MNSFLARIEGVNFGATLYDSDDLATIRGASYAYLKLPKLLARALAPAGWEVDDGSMVVGASDVVFSVRAPDGTEAAAIEQAIADTIRNGPAGALDGLRPFLSFSWAAVAVGPVYGEDVARLQVATRQRQLQQLTVDVPEPPEPNRQGRPCAVDRRRPAVAAISRGRRVSASVAARNCYGRNARRDFYVHELGDASRERFEVTENLQDLVNFDDYRRPAPSLPNALGNKMAVIYLDGNSFTKFRESKVYSAQRDYQEDAERLRQFTEFIRAGRRTLLRRMVDELLRAPHHRNAFYDSKKKEWQLRLETLLWGGDEALFVVPAWTAMALLPAIMAALCEGPRWDGLRLTHAVGIVICNVKTPIAVARALAERVANEAKDTLKDEKRHPDGTLERSSWPLDRLEDVVSIHIAESVEPPRDDIEAFRKRQYGIGKPHAFTLMGAAEVTKVLDLVREFQREGHGLPRSQLYGLIRDLRRDGLQHQGDAEAVRKFWNERVPEAFRRGKCQVPAEALRSPSLGFRDEAPLLPLIRLAELWDYVDPFGAAG